MAPFCLRGRFHNNSRLKLQLKNKKKKKRSGMENMQEKFGKLKADMEKISEEQKNIKEGQKQVRGKFEAIESECEELKRETRVILQQSCRNHVKLVLMFRILKAREQGDLATAAYLTDLLREIVGKENEEGHTSDDS